MSIVKVEGTNKSHRVFLYTLSTCGWCKKTKEFLRENGVEFEYLDMDLCSPEERAEAVRVIKERRAPLGFPIIMVDDGVVISGFKPDRIKEALGI
jgi:glutaredoxin-like protein NrdH